MCAVHLLPGQHACPFTSQIDDTSPDEDLENEVRALLARVNVEELCRAATARRGGIPCRFAADNFGFRKVTIKGIYMDAWIYFYDSVTWVVRIPRITALSHLPRDLIESFVQNEYATLGWLRRANIPALRAYGYGVASDPSNLVGVSYLFTEDIPGYPFNAFYATHEQKSRVYSQYARILERIRRRGPRDYACSLADTEAGEVEDAIASDRFTHLGRHGPYGTPLDYFASTAERYLELIADGQLYPEYPKEAFVFYRLLRDEAAPELARRSGDESKFFLKHMDDNGDHIRVDLQYNIKAIVNWQLARFVPAEEAFGPSLFTASIGRLYGGTPGMTHDDHLMMRMQREAGNQTALQSMSADDLARRFQLGLASGLSKAEVFGLIRAVLILLPSETAPTRS
ncbi:unnamed protein product [Clonostachys solani]|uniref:Uncharacterized protein n=1 Tax=Clonostachys solani TaxID=160281 RepID=A0A9N9Z7Q1_9HYPO|nr:unnamed protein product [Clonostachys solani]